MGADGPEDDRSRGATPADAPADADGQERLQGTLETITFHDEGSLYSVLRLAPEPGFKVPSEGSLFAPGRVTAVGKVAGPVEGARVRMTGKWARHPSHGPQF